jgi:RNA polymerase sigma-70 factor (ECF subfamily)
MDDAIHTPAASGFTYEQHGAHLRRYLMRRLRNAQDARELAQEVWTRLLRVQHPERILEPMAYVRRAAANVLIEFRMRQEREPVLFDSQTAEAVAENPAQAPPDELPERLDAQHHLQRLLAKLPQAYRQILLLRLCEGLSYEQIGARLELTAGTVERYFFRAMNTVRAAGAQGTQ